MNFHFASNNRKKEQLDLHKKKKKKKEKRKRGNGLINKGIFQKMKTSFSAFRLHKVHLPPLGFLGKSTDYNGSVLPFPLSGLSRRIRSIRSG